MVKQTLTLARVEADGLDLAAQGTQPANPGRQRLAPVAEAPEGIEHGELDLWTEERELFGLAVDVDDAGAELPEPLGGGGCPVDAPGRAPGEAHGALDRQTVVAGAHRRADAGALGAAGDDAPPVPAAEEKVERVDDDGLARAGLPGDDVQAGAGREGNIAGDGETGDGELLNHRWPWRC